RRNPPKTRHNPGRRALPPGSEPQTAAATPAPHPGSSPAAPPASRRRTGGRAAAPRGRVARPPGSCSAVRAGVRAAGGAVAGPWPTAAGSGARRSAPRTWLLPHILGSGLLRRLAGHGRADVAGALLGGLGLADDALPLDAAERGQPVFRLGHALAGRPQPQPL